MVRCGGGKGQAGIQVVRYEYSPRPKQNNHEISTRCLQVGTSFFRVGRKPFCWDWKSPTSRKRLQREEPRHRVTRVFRGLSIQKIEEGSLFYWIRCPQKSIDAWCDGEWAKWLLTQRSWMGRLSRYSSSWTKTWKISEAAKSKSFPFVVMKRWKS